MPHIERLEALKAKKQRIEVTIQDELSHPSYDSFKVSKLKKEKIFIKEEIEQLSRAS